MISVSIDGAGCFGAGSIPAPAGDGPDGGGAALAAPGRPVKDRTTAMAAPVAAVRRIRSDEMCINSLSRAGPERTRITT
ncbi:hypothetical protein OHA79_26460 [Streptomyces sp. NBC_00841]|uniref:hypothetical protein n=1 Tax=unclassified Streptomyces TaxID=2593676 RepID=UPI002258499D|nr:MULTISPECIES: hypothetical protein [unclassified Streptomyces]MCX4533518.1 hypothetical protein [Streptomyces sp. NBC_01669]WSA01072.1 hypothetical protein OHA79_26460 [Streptomyces sp. NBC_00841]